MRRWKFVGAAAAAVVLVAAGLIIFGGSPSYRMKVLVPAADGTFQGGKVMMRGHQVGEITEVGVRDDKAVLTARIDPEYAPLHSGTTARISWESVIGARVLELLPGPQANPPIDSGKLIASNAERVEIDDVFAALDPPTRARLQGVATQLQQTLGGREQDIKATLNTAGPTVHALGSVMRAVGDDGPAVRNLVRDLHQVTSAVAARKGDLGQTVGELRQFTGAAAAKQRALGAAVGQLPSTVEQADQTLGKVPGAADAARPLLADLRPATGQLPAVAANLSPVLRELGPTVASLRPTLESVRPLLDRTPGLLDTAHQTVPGIGSAVNRAQPAAAFLRPYTPELTGWLANWTGVFGSQTNGNYGRALITASASSLNANPGLMPPGLQQDPRPAPGAIAGQSWTDASGSGIR